MKSKVYGIEYQDSTDNEYRGLCLMYFTSYEDAEKYLMSQGYEYNHENEYIKETYNFDELAVIHELKKYNK